MNWTQAVKIEGSDHGRLHPVKIVPILFYNSKFTEKHAGNCALIKLCKIVSKEFKYTKKRPRLVLFGGQKEAEDGPKRVVVLRRMVVIEKTGPMIIIQKFFGKF